MISIQSAIGCEYEIQVPKITGEVAMAKIVGELRVQLRPNCHVDVLFHVDKQVVEKLWLSSAIAHREIFIMVLVGDFNSVDGVAYYLKLGVVEVEKDIVEL